MVLLGIIFNKVYIFLMKKNNCEKLDEDCLFDEFNHAVNIF